MIRDIVVIISFLVIYSTRYLVESNFIGELCHPLQYAPVNQFCIGCNTYTFDGLSYNPVIALPRVETGVLIENKLSILGGLKNECRLINQFPVRCFENNGANINNIRFELGGIDNQQLTIDQLTNVAYHQLLNQTIYLQCSRDFYSFNFCLLLHFVQTCPPNTLSFTPNVSLSTSTKLNSSIIPPLPTTNSTKFIVIGIFATLIFSCFILIGCIICVFLLYKLTTIGIKVHSKSPSLFNEHENENFKSNEHYETVNQSSLLRNMRPRSIFNDYTNDNPRITSQPFGRLKENLDSLESDNPILQYIVENYPAIIVPSTEERNYLNTQGYIDELNRIDFDSNTFFSVQQTFWSPGETENEIYSQFSIFKFREILYQHIFKGDFLGEGEFGKVHKGQWINCSGSLHIAIKSAKSQEKRDKILLLQEAAIMGQFSHPNIMKLIGVTTLTEPPMIIMEYMNNGDLDSYLNNKLDPRIVISHHLFFLRASVEIATGMKYISEKKFVHRDLAARNIFLDNFLTCKIADFGMSKKISQTEAYYIPNHLVNIPVKWTAPEALTEQKYSEASDIWSYGCLLYEIWSCGEKPWDSMTNISTVIGVLTGKKLKSPANCPHSIYFLINNCCEEKKQLRKTFAEVLSYLQQEVNLVPIEGK